MHNYGDFGRTMPVFDLLAVEGGLVSIFSRVGGIWKKEVLLKRSRAGKICLGRCYAGGNSDRGSTSATRSQWSIAERCECQHLIA